MWATASTRATLRRGAEVLAADEMLAGGLPAITSRIALSPGVEVVEVSTFTNVVDFERISAHGWGYPEPTTKQFEEAYAHLPCRMVSGLLQGTGGWNYGVRCRRRRGSALRGGFLKLHFI